MASIEPTRRLCVLFEAGLSRFAVETASVSEVASLEGARRIGQVLPLKDLSALLGGDSEKPPGMAVVLDLSPTLALRVGKVAEVADVSKAPVFMVPPDLNEALSLCARGALLHAGRLYVELEPRALSALGSRAPPPQRPIQVLSEPPERALVFETSGKLYGLPLSVVIQVASSNEAFWPAPGRAGSIIGLLPYAQALWTIHSIEALSGGEASRLQRGTSPALVVLAELAGQNVGFAASRVEGVVGVAGGKGPTVLFPDLQRMFS